jgi:hypothetical protein
LRNRLVDQPLGLSADSHVCGRHAEHRHTRHRRSDDGQSGMHCTHGMDVQHMHAHFGQPSQVQTLSQYGLRIGGRVEHGKNPLVHLALRPALTHRD